MVGHGGEGREAGAPQLIVLMGVSGVGKTTVGKRLADALGWAFFDGDDFHPPHNVAKMARGEPLDDADRLPWLRRLQRLIRQRLAAGEPAVLAASALKASYRDILCQGNDGVVVVYLRGSPALIRRRLEARSDHFMPPNLLRSQFAALETPADAVTVDVDQPPAAIVAAIREQLGL